MELGVDVGVGSVVVADPRVFGALLVAREGVVMRNPRSGQHKLHEVDLVHGLAVEVHLARVELGAVAQPVPGDYILVGVVGAEERVRDGRLPEAGDRFERLAVFRHAVGVFKKVNPPMLMLSAFHDRHPSLHDFRPLDFDLLARRGLIDDAPRVALASARRVNPFPIGSGMYRDHVARLGHLRRGGDGLLGTRRRAVIAVVALNRHMQFPARTRLVRRANGPVPRQDSRDHPAHDCPCPECAHSHR